MIAVWWMGLGCPGQPALPAAGRLAPCWRSPNCVSSQAAEDDPHYVAPIVVSSGGVACVEAALGDLPGAGPVTVSGTTLTVACRTPWGLFVDDVHVWVDEAAGVAHVRSSSRVGYGDLGVNRARITALQNAIEDRPGCTGPR